MATFRELVQIVITANSTQAIGAIRGVGAAADKDLKKATDGSRNLGNTFLKTGAILSVGGVAAFAAAASATIKFDKAMSAAGAVAGATEQQFGKLRQAALDAGADTAFSATEAAQGIEELSKAGISTSDILAGGLRGALDLAAAGNLELADAATIAAQAMNIFGLKGTEVTHVADVLAAGANKSAASVDSLGGGLEDVGAVAAAAGIGLEDTVGTLALFADNAVDGEKAGNALKSMLVAVQNPSRQAADTMRQYGIDIFNAKGEFIGLAGTAEELKNGLSGLTQEQRSAALATIFGNRGLVAANILYKEGGKGVREYAKAVNDQGAAADVAGKRLDNLAGDLEYLRGSIESALIEGGSRANGSLRLLVQTADGAVGVFSALPGPIQSATTALVAFSGVSLLISGSIIKFGPAFAESAKGVTKFGSAVATTVSSFLTGKIAFQGFGATLGQTTAGLRGAAAAQVNISKAVAEAAASATAAGQANRLLGGTLAAQSAAARGAAEANFILGGGLSRQASAAAEAAAANQALGAAQAKVAASATLASGGAGIVTAATIAGIAALTVGVLAAADALGYFDNALGEIKTSADSLAETSTRKLTNQLRALKTENDALIKSMKETNESLDTEKFTSQAEAMELFNEVLAQAPQYADKFIVAMRDAGFSTDAAEKKLRNYLKTQQGSAEINQAAAISTAALKDSIEGTTTAFDEFLKPFNEAATRAKEYTDGVTSAYEAGFSLVDATNALSASMADGNKSIQDRAKDIIAVAAASAELAVQQLGPGASAAQKQQAGFDAQVTALTNLRNQYPQMAPFIDGFIKDLQRASDAAGSNAVGMQAAISVLDALKSAYPQLTPEIDKLVAKLQTLTAANDASNVSSQSAIAVLEALKGQYPALAAEIDNLVGKLKDPNLTKGAAPEISAPGAEKAKTDIDGVSRAIGVLPARGDVAFSAPGASEAREEIDGVRGSLARMPRRTDTRVDAPGARDSKRLIDDHNRSANAIPPKKDTRVGAPGADQSKRSIDAHNASANSVPGSKNTNVSATGAASTRGELDGVKRSIDNIPNEKRVKVWIEGDFRNRFVALGGQVRRGELATVGEQGQELFIPRGVNIPATAIPRPRGLKGEKPVPVSQPAVSRPMVAFIGSKGEERIVFPVDGRVVPHQDVDSTLAKLGIDPKQVPRRALGGNVRRNRVTEVGEQGPELFIPRGVTVPPAALPVNDPGKRAQRSAKASTPGVIELGKKGREYFIPPTDGMVVPHQDVARTLAKLQPAVPKRALGGSLRAGQLAEVGEQGSELFVSNVRQLVSAGAGGGGAVQVTNHITVMSTGNEEYDGKKLAESLAKYERRNGAGWRNHR